MSSEGQALPAEEVQQTPEEQVAEVLARFGAAVKSNDRNEQAQIVHDLAGISGDEDALPALAQIPIVDIMAALLGSPPVEGDMELMEAGAVALSNTLAHVCHDADLKPRRGTRMDVADVVVAAKGVAAHVPKIARGVLPSLLKLLEEGSSGAQKAAAWVLHFIAVCAPDDGIKWAADMRKRGASALLGGLASLFGDVRISMLHALSMCMQRDIMFRADVAQVGGVPLFMRLLRDDDHAVVTASAGALHALVQGHKAYVPWILQIKGVPELLSVTERLPVSNQDNRHALLQVLWTLECIANADEPSAKALMDAGVLARVCSIITQAHGVSDEVQGAASLVIAGLVGGKDNKEPRPRVRTQVIDEIGVPVLRDFQENGCRVLSLVAQSILQHVTALQVEKGKERPAMPKLTAKGAPAAAPVVDEAPAAQLPQAVRAGPPGRGVQSTFMAKEALVIGLGNYEHLAKVKTAVRDAQDLAAWLTKAGFRVLTAFDTSSDLLRATMVQFEQRVMSGCLAMVTFVGHGGMWEGKRYLLPLDFRPPSGLQGAVTGEDVTPPTMDEMKEIRSRCGNLDASLDKMASKGVKHVVLLLDPCRKCKSAPSSLATAAPVEGPPPTTGSGSGAASNTPAAPPKPTRPPPGAVYGALTPGTKPKVPAAAVPAATKPAGTKAMASSGGSSDKTAGSGKSGGESARSTSPVKKPAAARAVSPGPTDKVKKGGPVRQNSLKAGAGVAQLAGVQSAKNKITEALDWTHVGLRASLCVWAAAPGTESFGAGKLSTSSKNSLFGEQLVKYIFNKSVPLRSGLEMVIKTVREASQEGQVPGYADDGLIGPDFKLMG